MNDTSPPDRTSPQPPDAAIAEAFAAHLADSETTPAPDFEQVWASANANAAQHTRRPRPALYAGAAAAVCLAAGLVMLTGFPTAPTPPATSVSEAQRLALFQEITRTTRWRAPSDQLLATDRGLQVWGVPAFGWQPNTEETNL